MNNEKDEEKLKKSIEDLKLEEIESPEELLEAINKLSGDHNVFIDVKKFQRGSGVRWWIYLLIETILTVVCGIGLIGILRPFIFENAYAPYIYLSGVSCLIAFVKIILRYINASFFFMLKGIIQKICAVLFIVVFTLFIPKVYVNSTFAFGLFILLLLLAESAIQKILRRF